MKKRKLLLISLISIIFSISAMGSSAFFNAEDTAHNVITSGSVNISVVETMLDGTELKDFPAEGIRGVMPGSTVSKIVRDVYKRQDQGGCRELPRLHHKAW